MLYPDDNKWYIQFLRFLNLLDDQYNELSPTKFNVWSANIAGVATFVASIFAWFGHHMDGIETLWGGTIGWLTHAHISRYNDKKEFNRKLETENTQQIKNGN